MPCCHLPTSRATNWRATNAVKTGFWCCSSLITASTGRLLRGDLASELSMLPCPQLRERAREGRTDAASSAGDEDRFVSEARIARRSDCVHISRLPRLWRETLLYSFSISKEISAMCRTLWVF